MTFILISIHGLPSDCFNNCTQIGKKKFLKETNNTAQMQREKYNSHKLLCIYILRKQTVPVNKIPPGSLPGSEIIR